MDDRLRPTDDPQRGSALLSAMILIGMLSTLLAGYFMMTRIDRSTSRASLDRTKGFYAAEAGANLRAETIRQIFVGYNRPSGTAPTPALGQLPCQPGGSAGDGDFACVTYDVQQRDVLTFVDEDAANPMNIVIPPGEAFQNLNAQEYVYTARSVAVGPSERTEAILDVNFRSRLVPLFQFAVFYNKDLEILPGPEMVFAGPVHTNGDLYIGANNTLTVEGQVTVADDFYNGRKEANSCMPGDVAIYDPAVAQPIPGCSGTRREIHQSDVTAWNGMVRIGVDPVVVPPPEALDPTPGEIYWDKADVRVVLDIDGATPAIEIRRADGSVDAAATAFLDGDCGGSTTAAWSTSGALHNHRENADIEMLEVDVQALLDCIQLDNAVAGGRALDDATEGGLVWYLTVEGADSGTVNDYGVRLRNGAALASSISGAPDVRGLTVVTDQAVYVQGDYNSDPDWRPAAFLADSLNVLSNSWDDANSASTNKNDRIASDTAIYAAFLGGTDLTGDNDGAAGQDGGDYNGGLENYPRFHEKWTGRTLTYRGSFVSLNVPRHVDGPWGAQSYSPPRRDWGYDTRFNDAANLPPLSPRFVYLKQDLFVRSYEL